MRHSIGGELLSSQGLVYSHQMYPLSGLSLQEKSSRRTNSVHDLARQSGTISGHMGFLPGRDSGREYHNAMKVDVGDMQEEEMLENAGSYVSVLTEMTEPFDEKVIVRLRIRPALGVLHELKTHQSCIIIFCSFRVPHRSLSTVLTACVLILSWSDSPLRTEFSVRQTLLMCP